MGAFAFSVSGGGGSGSVTLTGDVTGTGTGTINTTIEPASVTYGKFQDVSGNSVLVRNAVSTGSITTVQLANSRLVGRGSTGNIGAMSLGANLSFAGTVLNAIPSGADGELQFNSSGAFSSSSALTFDSASQTLRISSASTNGLSVFNTTDQTTNFERMDFRWGGNIAEVKVGSGGTGSTRTMRIGVCASGSTSILRYTEVRQGGTTSPFFRYVSGSGLNTSWVSFDGCSLTSSNGNQVVFDLNPQVAQTGTASYTVLKLNPLDTSSSSGAKYLLSAGINDVQSFAILPDGQFEVAATNTVTTVGGAGGASALPATPRGYLRFRVGTTTRQIPFYDI